MDPEKLKSAYDNLKIEYQVCKRKLDSKCEALQILTNDLDKCRQQRDQFKLMAEQIQQRYQSLKRQLAGTGSKQASADDLNDYTSLKSHSLAHMLTEMREYSKTLQFERDDFSQKLIDAQGDIKLLREQIARNRVGTTDEGMNQRHFPAHERQDLVNQLEASREQIAQLERDIQQVLDEKQDQETERDSYKTKFENLNKELNRVLQGDDNRLVDIDAMMKENGFLKERLDQMKEEKDIAHVTALKYKSILDKRKQKGILKLGNVRSSGAVISHKQVSELLQSRMQNSPQMMADLQAVATALLDTVNDKNVALSHQRKTNKILGNRVSELEKKVKTLEMSGLWTSPAAHDKLAGLDKVRLECEEIKKLLPHDFSASKQLLFGSDEQSSTANSDEAVTPCSSSDISPAHCHGNQAHATATAADGSESRDGTRHSRALLEDLDFLPTKDDSGGAVSQATNFENEKSSSDSAAAATNEVLSELQEYSDDIASVMAVDLDIDNLDAHIGHGDARLGDLELETQLQTTLDRESGSFDLELETQLQTKLDRDFDTFLCESSDRLVETEEIAQAELSKTTSKLHDLMSEMTLKVTDRSSSMRQESCELSDDAISNDTAAATTCPDNELSDKSQLLTQDSDNTATTGSEQQELMTSSLGV